MVRMQIQFTEQEVEALRSEASRRKISISALVREAVDRNDSPQGAAQPTRDELAQPVAGGRRALPLGLGRRLGPSRRVLRRLHPGLT